MTDTLQRMTAELQRDLDRLLAERAEHQRKAEELDRTIAAFERVITYRTGDSLPISSMVTEHASIANATPSRRGDQQHLVLGEHIGEWRRKLRGLTHIQALTQIAKENDGIVAVRDAKRILLEAGLTQGKLRNVSSHIYHTLARSEDFERTAPGVFSLVEPVLGTPASAPHPPGQDFITIEAPDGSHKTSAEMEDDNKRGERWAY